MSPKFIEQKRARELRRTGRSLSEIASLLNVSKSSVSIWVRDLTIPQQAQRHIQFKRDEARKRAAATNRDRLVQKLGDARSYGEDIVRDLVFSQNMSRLICALMYWCEGSKIRKSEMPAFTNSDPLVVASFMRLLRQSFDIDEQKLRLVVHLHEYHNDDEQLRFWSKVTSIPLSQCYRPYRKSNTGKRIRDEYQGCASVRYLDVDFGRRLEAIAKVFLEKTGSVV